MTSARTQRAAEHAADRAGAPRVLDVRALSAGRTPQSSHELAERRIADLGV